MNKVFLMGNLTRDVDVKSGVSGNLFARTGIAVKRPFTKDKDATDFFNLVAFGKTAEFLQKYFAKGSRILVEGRLQTGTYQDKDGNQKNTVDIIVDNAEFADSKKKDGDSNKANDRGKVNDSKIEGTEIDESDTPF